ncbi:MAG: LysR substrate-binding domain-containing protein [Bilifractor sp.]|nr:LysR substrate-binding domain-containing protein [Bilifractor sp.]
MSQMKNDEELLKRELSSDRSNKKITFGVTMTIGEYAISGPVSGFLKEHPDMDFVIHFGNTAELLKNLQDGSIDFALVEGYYPDGLYDTILYQTEKFIPVCASRHRFPKNPEQLSDLFSERLLVREPGSGTRNILERALSLGNHGIDSFYHYIQVENMHTIIQFLCCDCGISFLYQAAVEDELKLGILQEIPLSDFSIRHDFTFLWPKDSVFSEEIRSTCMDIKSRKELARK